MNNFVELFSELQKLQNLFLVMKMVYGLPVSAAYAKHFGGRLLLVSQHQWGMDAFLSLKHLDDDKATVYL